MPTLSANQALILYIWFALAILLSLLLLIARFYQTVSQERTYYPGFGFVIIIFAAASARDVFVDSVSGDLLSDSLWLTGAVLLAAICVHLYRSMTAGRP